MVDILDPNSSADEGGPRQPDRPRVVRMPAPDNVSIRKEGLSPSGVEDSVGHRAAAPVAVRVVHDPAHSSPVPLDLEPDEASIGADDNRRSLDPEPLG